MNFDNVYINYWASTVGKKEYEGPLCNTFDAYDPDEYFGCDSFEKAESLMQKEAMKYVFYCKKSFNYYRPVFAIHFRYSIPY